MFREQNRSTRTRSQKQKKNPFPQKFLISSISKVTETESWKVCDHEIESFWTQDGLSVGHLLLQEFFTDFLMELYSSKDYNPVNRWKHFFRKDLSSHTELSGCFPRTPDDCWVMMSWSDKQKVWDTFLKERYPASIRETKLNIQGWCYDNLYDVLVTVFWRLYDEDRRQVEWVNNIPFSVMENTSTF